jgi:penicillin-binding protein 1C
MKRFIATTLWSVVALSLLIGLIYGLCPKPELRSYIPYSKAYFDDEGKLLRFALAKDDRYRLYIELENMSPAFVEATILYEDQHYYEHLGVDFLALFRAFWTTYITQERRIGASTIVMQLARLRWGIPSNTLRGKLYQIGRALQLSRHYSKEQMVEAYLNLTSYGRNIEGVGAASLIYFNKRPSELSLPEALTLAVIPQNPNKRNPTTKKGYKYLLTARRNLFERWLKLHPEDQSILKFLDLPLAIRSPESLPFKAPHFVNHVQQQLSDWDSGYINTTLNLTKQRYVEQVLQDYVESKSIRGIRNASALLVNYQTHSIEAMVGSADFYANDIAGQVNGTTAKRSPGSALKPFVYALALEEGLVHPMSLLKDSPRKFGGFTPENYDKQFLGPVSVKNALITSRNVPAVVLQSRLSKKSLYQLLLEAGVTGLKHEGFYGLALALGGGEVTSIELATLYAMLANSGVVNPLKSIKGNKQQQGKTLLSPEVSYLVLDMLKDNPPPGALDMDIFTSQKNDVAWKTGTSWAFRDAWAVGVSGPYVLVVWVGNFDGRGNNAFIGRSAAGPLFFRLFDAVYPDQNWQFDKVYPIAEMNLKKLKICANTGDLYETNCPVSTETWFIPGVSPIKLSNIYRKLPINKQTGLRACWHEPGKTQMEVFEFWPSDFLEIYNQAGISLKTPPQYEPGCGLGQTSSSGQIPVITSPQSSIDYVVRMNSKEDNWIPLKAIVDPDVKTLHWFIEGEYIGSSSSGESLLWKSKPGRYEVSVVDGSGRGASKRFKVITTHL